MIEVACRPTCILGDTTCPHVGKSPRETAASHPWNEPELNLHSHCTDWGASNVPIVGYYVLTQREEKSYNWRMNNDQWRQ